MSVIIAFLLYGMLIQDRPVLPSYEKAQARAVRKCEGLAPETVAELDRVLVESGETEKPKLAKVARVWSRSKDLPSAFRHCISATTTLRATPKYPPPPPPPKLRLEDLDEQTRTYIQRSESVRVSGAKREQDELGRAQRTADVLSRATVDKNHRPRNIRFVWQITTPTKFKTNEGRIAAIQEANVELDSARSQLEQKLAIFCEPPLQPSLNQVGHLPFLVRPTEVLQVISDTEAHVQMRVDTRTNRPSNPYISSYTHMILRGVSTKGWTVGSYPHPAGVFYISDTETYKTVAGSSNTVLVVVPAKIDWQAVERWKNENGLK